MKGQAWQSSEAGCCWATAKERSIWIKGRCCEWQAGGKRGVGSQS